MTPDAVHAIPRTLTAALAWRPVPMWLREAAALPDDATVEALHPRLLQEHGEQFRRRVERFLWRLLRSGPCTVRRARVLDQSWPADLDPHLLPLDSRTRRCLADAQLLADASRMTRLTYGELLDVPGVGPKAVLDFAAAAEAAVDSALAKPPIPLTLGASALEAPPQAQHVNGAVQFDLALRDYVATFSRLGNGELDALVRRLGLEGKPPQSLARAVNGANLSAERLRQYERRVRMGLRSQPIDVPALDQALGLVAAMAPLSAMRAAQTVHEAGFASVPFGPESLLAAARLCGRVAPFELAHSSHEDYVVPASLRPRITAITSLASRRARVFGAASVLDIAAAIDVSSAEVRIVLEHQESFEFLDDTWFWLPAARKNQLALLTRKMLAVASPLDVTTIRRGLCRATPRTNAALVAPAETLLRFYGAHDFFTLDADGRVGTRLRLDPDVELAPAERIFLEVLRSSDSGVLDRAAFDERCRAHGLRTHNFNAATQRSAVLDQPARNVWCLVGSSISSQTIDALRRTRAEARPQRRVVDYGRIGPARIWFAARVPERGAGGFVIQVPAPLARDIAGRRFAAYGEDGSAVGSIAVSMRGASWGYLPFLSRAGAAPGDVLEVNFHVTRQQATVRLVENVRPGVKRTQGRGPVVAATRVAPRAVRPSSVVSSTV